MRFLSQLRLDSIHWGPTLWVVVFTRVGEHGGVHVPCTCAPVVASILFCLQIRIVLDQGVFPDDIITFLSIY